MYFQEICHSISQVIDLAKKAKQAEHIFTVFFSRSALKMKEKVYAKPDRSDIWYEGMSSDEWL